MAQDKHLQALESLKYRGGDFSRKSISRILLKMVIHLGLLLPITSCNLPEWPKDSEQSFLSVTIKNSHSYLVLLLAGFTLTVLVT